MQLANPVFFNRGDVFFSPVPNMLIKPVLREFSVISFHNFVPVDFSNNRGKFYGIKFFIASYDSMGVQGIATSQ